MANFKQETHFGAVFANQSKCAQCEAMLPDVLDGTLTAEEQEHFDAHMTTCTACSQMLADARRGAAWLELLRTPRPEPPATLLERILAQTSAPSVLPEPMAMPGMEPMPSAAPFEGVTPQRSGMASVLPFRSRFQAAMNCTAVGHAVLQPRLAMTAAMAFFSIGLTLNLTGVRLNELRPADLKPANLRRSLYQADAHLVRYYDNLRVVYELESRVRDLQRATEVETERTPNPETTPEKKKPGDDSKTPQPKQTRPSGPGTSRRQGVGEARSLSAYRLAEAIGQQSSVPNQVQVAYTTRRPSAPEGGRA